MYIHTNILYSFICMYKRVREWVSVGLQPTKKLLVSRLFFRRHWGTTIQWVWGWCVVKTSSPSCRWLAILESSLQIISCSNSPWYWVGTAPIHWPKISPPQWIEPVPEFVLRLQINMNYTTWPRYTSRPKYIYLCVCVCYVFLHFPDILCLIYKNKCFDKRMFFKTEIRYITNFKKILKYKNYFIGKAEIY